jgi:hypothetical protein
MGPQRRKVIFSGVGQVPQALSALLPAILPLEEAQVG